MIICGHCHGRHHQVDTVRACRDGRTFPCDWLVERHSFDDETGERHDFIVECGATAVTDDRGFHCEAGHEHVELEVRLAEGWDYASDEEEAAGRAGYGFESRLPDGHIYLPIPPSHWEANRRRAAGTTIVSADEDDR